MDTLMATWTFITDSVLPYAQYIWPFVFTTLVSTVVGQLLKHRLWTPENAKLSRAIAVGRATIPLHPLLAGTALGILWKNPCGVPWTTIMSAAYFATAGITSLIGYLFLDKWAEKRFGVDIDVVFMEPLYPVTPALPDARLEAPTEPDAADVDGSDVDGAKDPNA